MTPKNISIEFGALVKPISEQLKTQGIEVKNAERLDHLADAIVDLHLNHIIPDSVRDKAREKLMKIIVSEIQNGG